MCVLHLTEAFNQSDEIISLAESIGFAPAPVISKYCFDDDGNILPIKELLAANEPNSSYLNADKVFIHKGSNEFEQIYPTCMEILNTAFDQYPMSEVTDDWIDLFELEYVSIIKYSKGGFFHKHSDLIVQPGNNFRSFTIVAYLSEFEGGELIFPNQDITITPTKGDIAIFPSGELYPHQSAEITKGTKYALTLWPLVNKELKLKVRTDNNE